MGNIAGLEVGIPDDMLDPGADWMTSVLRTSGAIDGSTSVASVSVEPFQVGVGLLGQLGRASLTFDGGDGPATVIIKWPIDVPHQRGMADALNAYDREVRYYRELAERSPLRVPTIHAAMIAEDKSNCVIVMEDLSAMRQGDRINGMTWDEAVEAVKTLARWHAYWQNHDELEALGETFYPIQHPVYNVILPQFMDAGWAKCQEYGAEHLTPEIIEFGERWVELLPLFQQHFNKDVTLIHADWRADNMFIDDNGEIVLIDFQLAGIGVGGYDLGYFVSQSLERDVRGGRERELVEIYCAALAEHGVQRDFDTAWFNFRVSIAWCLIYGVSSFAEFENLPGEGQFVLTSLLRRCTAGITDVDAIAAADELKAMYAV